MRYALAVALILTAAVACADSSTYNWIAIEEADWSGSYNWESPGHVVDSSGTDILEHCA